MDLTSAVFIFAFLPLSVLIHAAVRNVKARNIILAVFSLVYWAWCGVFALPVLLLITAADHFGAKSLERATGGSKKLLFIALIILNFAPLAACFVFKKTVASPYAPKLFCFGFLALKMTGYLIDVYSGKCERIKNFGRLLLYSSFFALTQRGPIVSYSALHDRLNERRVPIESICKGICDFVAGLAMKVIVSDTLAASCDKLYALEGADLNILTAWIAAVLFFLQLFFDLFGYSKMAVGIGRMFGFDLSVDFSSPVFAESFSGFVKKWYVTVAAWFADFVFAPVSKCIIGSFGAALGVAAACAAAALWLKPSIPVLMCFALIACFIIIEIALKKLGVRIPRGIGIILAIIGAVIAFAPLRMDGSGAALRLYKAMFAGFAVTRVSVSRLSLIMKPNAIFAAVIAVILASPLGERLGRMLSKESTAVRIVRYLLTVLLFAACIMVLLSTDAHPGFFETI